MLAQAEVVSTVAKELPWQEMGIAGLVIAALFGIVFYQMRTATAERKETRLEHKSERADWQKEHSERAEKMETVVKELTIAVRERRRDQ